MAHEQQQKFCQQVVNIFPEMFNGGLDVLEVVKEF